MKTKQIDTLKWSPSERLNKTLFVRFTFPSAYNKDFADVLASAKRCHDVRLFTEEAESTTVYYLTNIGVDSKTGKSYMTFASGDQTHRWDEPAVSIVAEQPSGR